MNKTVSCVSSSPCPQSGMGMFRVEGGILVGWFPVPKASTVFGDIKASTYPQWKAWKEENGLPPREEK